MTRRPGGWRCLGSGLAAASSIHIFFFSLRLSRLLVSSFNFTFSLPVMHLKIKIISMRTCASIRVFWFCEYVTHLIWSVVVILFIYMFFFRRYLFIAANFFARFIFKRVAHTHIDLYVLDKNKNGHTHMRQIVFTILIERHIGRRRKIGDTLCIRNIIGIFDK